MAETPISPDHLETAASNLELTLENQILRELLWLNHGHGHVLYGDDGEMQCSLCRLDFRRDSAQQIQKHFRVRGMLKLAAAQGKFLTWSQAEELLARIWREDDAEDSTPGQK